MAWSVRWLVVCRWQLTSTAEVGQVVGSPGAAVDWQASGWPGVRQPGVAGVAGIEQAGPTGRGREVRKDDAKLA